MLEQLYEFIDDNIALLKSILETFEKHDVMDGESAMSIRNFLNTLLELVKQAYSNDTVVFNVIKLIGVIESVISTFYWFGKEEAKEYLEFFFRTLQDENFWIKVSEWRER